MKALLPLLAALCVVACKRPDKSVEYRATGYNASVQYVDQNEVWQTATLTSRTRVDTAFVDTTIAGVDTVLAITSTVLVPAEWYYTFDAPHDGTARVVITQEFGNAPGASASLAIDGITVATGSVERYRDQVTLVP
jgi:hypothetical protein